MAEEITKYSTIVEFDATSAIKKLNAYEKRLAQFYKKQQKLYKLKIPSLQPSMPSSPSGTPTSTTMKRDPMTAHLKERERHMHRMYKEREREAVQLEKLKANIRRSAWFQKELTTEAQKEAMATLKSRMQHIKKVSLLRDEVARTKKILNMTRQQSAIMQRMTASSKQYATNMFSAFAIAGTGAAVTRTGQEFEAVNNTLLAVSGSAEAAADNFKFVRDEAYRLGASLTSTSKDFAKLVAGAEGQISKEDTRELLTGMLEVSATLGLTADDTAGSIRALQQMLGKTKVSAEELNVRLAA